MRARPLVAVLAVMFVVPAVVGGAGYFGSREGGILTDSGRILPRSATSRIKHTVIRLKPETSGIKIGFAAPFPGSMGLPEDGRAYDLAEGDRVRMYFGLKRPNGQSFLVVFDRPRLGVAAPDGPVRVEFVRSRVPNGGALHIADVKQGVLQLRTDHGEVVTFDINRNVFLPGSWWHTGGIGTCSGVTTAQRLHGQNALAMGSPPTGLPSRSAIASAFPASNVSLFAHPAIGSSSRSCARTGRCLFSSGPAMTRTDRMILTVIRRRI